MPLTPSIASTDQATLDLIEESSFGVHPGSGQTAQLMRFNSHTIKPNQETKRSQEIVSSRAVANLKRTRIGAGGTINTELSWGSHESLMLAAIGAAAFTAPAAVNSGVDFATDASAGTITGTGIDDDVVVGMFIAASTFSNSAVNTYYKVIGVDTDELTVDPKPAATVASGTGAIVGFDYAKNGTSLRSFSIEEHLSDLSNEYKLGTGMMVQNWGLSAEKGELISQTFEVLLKSFVPTTSSATSGSSSAKTTTEIMSTVDDIFGLVYGTRGAAALVDIESFNFQTNANLREIMNLGDAGPSEMNHGKFFLTGNMTAYFANQSLLKSFTDFDDNKRFAFIVKDTDNNVYAFDFPRIRFSDGGAPNEGENSDFMTELSFEAIQQVAEGAAFWIHKLAGS